jgi:predicted RNA-binding Zn-ribbon protein involved in translation (DUF1610 family)
METVASMNIAPRKDGAAVIVRDRTGVIAAPNFGDLPVRTLCTACRKAVMTTVTPSVGLGTWLIALLLLLIFFPLAIVPFLISACKDKKHTCPNCGTLLGIKKIIG